MAKWDFGVNHHRVLDKPLVTDALERLGTDRVMRAHVALEHGDGGDWHNCFLAMAFGGYGKLWKNLGAAPDPVYDVARILDLTVREVWAITDAYDHHRAEFQNLVEEWLELNVLGVRRFVAAAPVRKDQLLHLFPDGRVGAL